MSVAADTLPPLPPVPMPKVEFAWEYPSQELSTNLTFRLYCATNIAEPRSNWVFLREVVGTNLQMSVLIEPGHRWFFLTASNLWGESDPSNPCATPHPPRVGSNLRVQRVIK
jgi:hypothetical protein